MKETKNENLLISIIIPCYNVEKYVKKCIDSIMKQTYQNLDVIVIDDKSKDNTYEILKKLKKEYGNKFRLYQNEENKGLAGTRNFGVKIAKGEYIGFIDSDDYVDEFYYYELVKTLNNNDADLVFNDICLINEDGSGSNRIKAIIGNDISKQGIIDNGLAASACNKLLRKDLLLRYPFLEGRINEDVASIIPIIVHSNKLAYNEKSIYYYVQRKGSIQNSEFNEKRFDMFESVKVCLDRIRNNENYEVYRDYIYIHQLLEIYIYILIKIENSEKRKDLIFKFANKLTEYQFDICGIRMLNNFINRHRKKERFYYWCLIKLLKYKNIEIINAIINIRNNFKSNIYKLVGKNKENGKYTIKELERISKNQSKMKKEDVKISVIIPNYNYKDFLIKRTYSVLAQSTKIYELIILDDCSKDGSRELIDEIVKKIKPYINVKKIYNDVNSGGAFNQWCKGIDEATGDYIWIAEADDYCSKKLLKYLIKPIHKDKNIYISYADTAFTYKNGNIFLKSIKSEIDIMKTKHWDNDYINNGIDEISNFTFLNNTIANVSSCIIKKANYENIYEDATKYKQAGDWIFYLNIMSKGDIAYTNKVLNYYRVHSTQITSNMDKRKHLEEIKDIYKYIEEKFGTNKFQKQKRNERIEFLKKAWNIE